MCGIFGVFPVSSKNCIKAKKSLKTLSHRGPDQSNYILINKLYMGHNRLSILDVSQNGMQPMRFGKVNICVNGEIYNYKSLKKELEKKFDFKSESDSEIILYGYIEWGIDLLLKKIDGMYAISIYDEKTQTIFLARDRAGIKPIYYSNEKFFIWGSELKAIENFLGSKNLVIDKTAIYDFLTYLYVPTPKTLYKNINKLEPAHYIKYDLKNRKVTLKKYWDLPVIESQLDYKNATNKLKSLLKESVNEQLMSDVPVGAFLSGGIDSTIITSLASLRIKKLRTFTIGFDNYTFNESEAAKIVSREIGSLHTEKILKNLENKNIFDTMIPLFDEPFADTSSYPCYKVSEIAKDNVRVVLTGDGGDELFAGYKWYNSFKRLNDYSIKLKSDWCRRALLGIKSKLNIKIFTNIIDIIDRKFFLSGMDLYCSLLGGLTRVEKTKHRRILQIADNYDDYWYFNKFNRDDLTPFKRLQYIDFHTYLHDDVLTKVDRTSMAHSIECRVPFLKKEIIEFAFSLPEEFSFKSGISKRILKNAFTNEIPEKIIKRSKKGFSIPWNTGKLFSKNWESRQFQVLKKFSKIKHLDFQ